jgi:hypothetical protein
MSFKIPALFVDARREFPHKFSEVLWPDIQFTSFDRVVRLNEAVQKHLKTEFNICFISEQAVEPLTDFFTDIVKLGRESSCLYVQLLQGKASESPDGVLAVPTVAGFDIAVHEEFSRLEYQALKDKLGVLCHKVELARRTNDIDSSVKLLMRLVDDAALQRKRGWVTPLRHGVTSLLRMHGEFDNTFFNGFLTTLTDSCVKATPDKRVLQKIPLPLLKRNLPALSDQGYLGVSNRVYRLLSERFGDSQSEPLGSNLNDSESKATDCPQGVASQTASLQQSEDLKKSS